MPQIIDGKQIAMQIKEELKERVARLKQAGKSVCLAVIPVSYTHLYVLQNTVVRWMGYIVL